MSKLVSYISQQNIMRLESLFTIEAYLAPILQYVGPFDIFVMSRVSKGVRSIIFKSTMLMTLLKRLAIGSMKNLVWSDNKHIPFYSLHAGYNMKKLPKAGKVPQNYRTMGDLIKEVENLPSTLEDVVGLVEQRKWLFVILASSTGWEPRWRQYYQDFFVENESPRPIRVKAHGLDNGRSDFLTRELFKDENGLNGVLSNVMVKHNMAVEYFKMYMDQVHPEKTCSLDATILFNTMEKEQNGKNKQMVTELNPEKMSSVITKSPLELIFKSYFKRPDVVCVYGSYNAEVVPFTNGIYCYITKDGVVHPTCLFDKETETILKNYIEHLVHSEKSSAMPTSYNKEECVFCHGNKMPNAKRKCLDVCEVKKKAKSLKKKKSVPSMFEDIFTDNTNKV